MRAAVIGGFLARLVAYTESGGVYLEPVHGLIVEIGPKHVSFPSDRPRVWSMVYVSVGPQKDGAETAAPYEIREVEDDEDRSV